MQLEQLSSGLPGLRDTLRARPVEITDVAFDSRRAGPGTLFVCVPGMTSDGHEFAPAAVEAGAAALVVERPLELDVPQLLVEDARRAMGPLAAALFGDPSSELTCVAITGTNGKTTTAFLVRAILEGSGTPCGLLGTVKRVVGGREEEVERTTPEAIDLQRTLRRMVDAGDRACAMEVSSHALVLGRVDGIRFEVAAFTNLTQDHLDFHADMEDYYAAKRLLFAPGGSGVLPPAAAAVNVDDDYGVRLAEELRALGAPPLITFSARGADGADLLARDVAFDANGSRFELVAGEYRREVRVPLPGHFNVENALAALACALALGIDVGEAAASLADAEPVPGRMEPIDEGQPFGVLVDYAHTPDSLENVLQAARRLTSGRLISVFGCGGDRDPLKRPLMGRAGAELSDLPIVTSDNPRSEDPLMIIEGMLSGVPAERRDAVVVEPDRRAAIAAAISAAAEGDLIVIAGKGHEQGQEFEGGRKVPFDDRRVAREELSAARDGSAA